MNRWLVIFGRLDLSWTLFFRMIIVTSMVSDTFAVCGWYGGTWFDIGRCRRWDMQWLNEKQWAAVSATLDEWIVLGERRSLRDGLMLHFIDSFWMWLMAKGFLYVDYDYEGEYPCKPLPFNPLSYIVGFFVFCCVRRCSWTIERGDATCTKCMERVISAAIRGYGY